MKAAAIIAEARKRAGLTQAQLAERMGTHQPVVARWETGRTTPDFATVSRAVGAAGFELSVAIVAADDHDLALIRRELMLTPPERLAGMVAAVNALAAMDDAVRG
jgi:transcriptional regulator with XRE-family HTH domain